MKFQAALQGYSPLSEARVKHAWKEGIFCLDTNVLHDLYHYTEDSRTASLKILRSLKAQVFVPARVAVEFARRRPGVISEYFKPHRELRRLLQEFEDSLGTTYKDNGDRDKLIEAVKKMRAIESEMFSVREATQMALLKNDPILVELLEIVGEDVGDPLPADDIVKEYERRRTTGKLPPFCVKDHQKQGGGIDVTSGDDVRTGDVAIWLEVIAHCEDKKKPLVFVTGDLKENWWLSTGELDVPQPSLVQEFFQRVQTDVLFYTPEKFWDCAPGMIGGEKSEQLVTEAKELERRSRTEPPFFIDHFGLGQDHLRFIHRREKIRELAKQSEELDRVLSVLKDYQDSISSDEDYNRLLKRITESQQIPGDNKKTLLYLANLLRKPEGLDEIAEKLQEHYLSLEKTNATSFLEEAMRQRRQETLDNEGTSSEA